MRVSRLIVLAAALVCALFASGCGNRARSARWARPRACTSTSTSSSTRSRSRATSTRPTSRTARTSWACPRAPRTRRGRDLLRRLHPRLELDRRGDRAGQRLRDHRHAGEHLPADPARRRRQPVRLPARADPAQGPDPGARLGRLRGRRSRARCCSSRSRPPRSRTARSSSASAAGAARPASSTSTSEVLRRGWSGACFDGRHPWLRDRASPLSAASITVFAAGAAVSPPAPWPTSSTQTATCGSRSGAKAVNQASVSVVSSSGGGWPGLDDRVRRGPSCAARPSPSCPPP